MNTTQAKSRQASEYAKKTMTPRDALVLDLADFMADVFEDREEYFTVISKALTAYHHLTPSDGTPAGEGRMVLDLIDAIEIAECL